MDFSTDANIQELISILNQLYSINYACLNFANQEGSFDGPRIVGNELFRENQISKSWQKAKMSDASAARNSVFAYFRNKQATVNQNSNFDEELNSVKTPLINFYNEVFETNKKFEDVFVGFKIKDKNFEDIAKLFNIHSTFMTNSETVHFLMQSYHNYIQTYKYYTTLKAFDEIFEVLSDDLTESGYPSIYFNKTSNPKILRITQKQIDEFSSSALKISSQIEQDIKTENLTIAPLYKQARKLARKKQNPHEIYQQINISKSNIFAMINEQKVAATLLNYIEILKQRMISANTPYGFDGFFGKTISVFDKLMKTGSSQKEDFKVEKIYVHKYELEYLEFLFDLLKMHKSPSMQTSNDKEQMQ